MPRRKENFKSTNRHINTRLLNLNQIQCLIKSYPTTKNKDLAEKYRCSMSFLNDFAKYYDLKKDEVWLKDMRASILINRNKNITGRNLTNQLLRSIAKKYDSKAEFQYKDPSAYATANRRGIIEEITTHMKNMNFSIPQIITRQITEYLLKRKCSYNNRKVIKPYEIDVYFPKLKIGFEYDGKGWHLNDSVDKQKICFDKNILLITIVENSRHYEKDIKDQIIKNLGVINKWCDTNITKKDVNSFKEKIDFPKLFTEKELTLLRNNTTAFLRKNHLNLYNKYYRYNPDNIDFYEKYKEKKFYTEEKVKTVLEKYSSIKELLKNNRNVYSIVHKKFRHLLPLYGESNNKKVLCITSGKVFKSAASAARYYNLHPNSVSRVCRGERQHTKSYRFKYL